RPGKVQDRYELQHIILGHADTTQTRALDTHIKRLRHKLGAHATCIATERGCGYYFDPPHVSQRFGTRGFTIDNLRLTN
ncbi:MAG: helix-turn-helix domain-containing protein, partial [Akkermansia sp.]|nr:helix-turn-helix domain-containing protein [Akkermansia sp.]